MATQLVTNVKSLKDIKRALQRSLKYFENSPFEECQVIHIIKHMTSCNSALNNLIASATKYDDFIDAVAHCSRKKHDCKCNKCGDGKSASDLFGVFELLKNSQCDILNFHHDVCQLTRALIDFYACHNICIPCDKKLRIYVSDLYCCPSKANDDCCENNALIYGIALIVLLGLLFGNVLGCVLCPGEHCDNSCSSSSSSSSSSSCGHQSCNSHHESQHQECHESNQSHQSHHESHSCNHYTESDCSSDECCSDSFDSDCHNKPVIINDKGCCKDPCNRRCPSIYESSLKGVQLILELNNKDHVNKWFALVGNSIATISSRPCF